MATAVPYHYLAMTARADSIFAFMPSRLKGARRAEILDAAGRYRRQGNAPKGPAFHPRARPGRVISQPGAIHAGLVEQFGHAGARVEHAGLHGVQRDARAPRHRFDRLVLEIEQVDYLALRRRQLRQALLENLAPILLVHLGRRVVRRVFDRHRETTLHNIFYILRQRLHERGMEFESRGSDVVDRVPVEVVDVIDASNFVVRVYFHQSTKLPVKQSFSRLDPKSKERDEEVTRFDRYRDNQGIQWPQQITRERNGEKIYQIFADSVSFNQDLTDDLFSITSSTRKK